MPLNYAYICQHLPSFFPWGLHPFLISLTNGKMKYIVSTSHIDRQSSLPQLIMHKAPIVSSNIVLLNIVYCNMLNLYVLFIYLTGAVCLSLSYTFSTIFIIHYGCMLWTESICNRESYFPYTSHNVYGSDIHHYI